MSRKAFYPILAIAVAVVAVAWADGSSRTVRRDHGRVKAAGPVAQGTAAPNLLTMHDPQSADYNGDCLSCHAGVLTETTQDPRIPSFHQAMLPFTPGYNPAHGPNNDVCVQCHRFVELQTDSAGALRKQVDPALCALCHGPSGPGPVFYQR